MWSYSTASRADLPSQIVWDSWVGNFNRDKITQSGSTPCYKGTCWAFSYSVSCVHGNPKTICFNWDLVLQFLSPGHFKFFILAEILSLELDTWQSALPTKFQLNSFTFDCNAFLCTRMKDQTRFFILFIFSSPGPWPQFNVPLWKIPLIIFITQFF